MSELRLMLEALVASYTDGRAPGQSATVALEAAQWMLGLAVSELRTSGADSDALQIEALEQLVQAARNKIPEPSL